jgi:C-methyltransferase.
VEINPLKFNTYFPGTKIPVYDQANTKFPDVYLLLSWKYRDEIVPKLKNFMEKGGKILLPIPKVELI